MRPMVRFLLASGVPVVLLTLVGVVLAVYPPAIRDEGKFFKPETVEKANAKIHAIYKNYRKDVIIETYPSIPPETEKKFRGENKLAEDRKLDEDERKELFRFWSRSRQEELGVNGVYVLINRKPAHLDVSVDRETERKALTVKERNKMAKRLLEQFKDHEFDSGLLTLLENVESDLKTNLK
jgi:TPM domain